MRTVKQRKKLLKEVVQSPLEVFKMGLLKALSNLV